MRTFCIFRTADAPGGEGGSASTSLFEQLFADNKKTLEGQNKEFLSQDLKMRFIGACNTAKGQVLQLTQDLNKERAKLSTMNLNAILDIKAKIRSWNDQITGAQEEYKILFGSDMPTSI